GRGDRHGVGAQPPPAREAGRRDETHRHAGAAEQLDEAGGEPALRERAHVAAEAPVPARTQQIVHEAQEPEPEHGEQHEAAGQGQAGFIADPDRARDRAPGLDHEQGQDNDDPARGRERVPAVVAPLERRVLEHLAPGDAQEPGRDGADEDPDEDAHERVAAGTRSGSGGAASGGAASAGSAGPGTTRRGTNTSKTMMAGFRTLSIMPGTAMPESFSANPRTDRIANPMKDACSSGTQSVIARRRSRRLLYRYATNASTMITTRSHVERRNTDRFS